MSDLLAPVLGDPFEVSAVGSSLTSIALDVASQAARLRSLVDSSWTGTASTAARSRTATLPPMLDKAHASYATAGGALSSYARSLASAQQQSATAIAAAFRAAADLSAARSAQAAASAQDARAAALARAALLPAPPSTASRYEGAIEEAAANLQRAYALNSQAHDQQDAAARAAASSLAQASHDGIHNASWMHDFTHAVGSWASAHWVDTLRVASKVGQAVSMTAGMVALVLAVGGAFFPPLEAVAAIAETVSLTGAGVAAVADTALAASGNGSWTTVGIDAVTLAPAGLGKLVTKVTPLVREGRFLVPKTVVHASTGLYGANGIAADGSHLTWGRESELTRHFNDHGADFGATTEDEYVDQAHMFLQEALAGDHPMKTWDRDDSVRIFDPNTERFGSYNSDFTTRTFYEPDPVINRVDNWTYFLQQKGVRVQ